jgi:hypothetical protein
VLPKDMAHEQAATLTIAPDYPAKSPKLFYANVRVTKGAEE